MIKYIITTLIVLVSLSYSYSIFIENNVTETTEIIKRLDGVYVYKTQGVINITNPSLASQVYEYRLTMDAPTGVYGSFTSEDNLTINFNGILGFYLSPNESVSISYRYSGLTTENYTANFSNGQTFIEQFSTPTYVVKTQINVDKPIRELENSTNVSNRVVGSQVTNPTEFHILLRSLELYRTNTSNPFFGNGGQVVSFYENIPIDPFESIRFDVRDRQSTSSSVYWVKQSITADWNWTTDFNYTYIEQTPLVNNRGGGGSSSAGGNNNNNDDDSVSVLNDSVDLDGRLSNLIIKKDVDKVFVSQGEELTVYLRIMNIGAGSLYNVSFTDEIPPGYELVSIDGARVEGNELHYYFEELDGYSETLKQYVLRKTSSDQSLTYFKPVEFDGDAVVEGVLVIENILGDAKLFVQKEVEWIDSDFSKIKITIKNVGEAPVKGFKLIEEIDDQYLLKDILRAFDNDERGQWYIPELVPGEEWEVEYLVESHDAMSEAPLLVGVDESDVYTTVIFDSLIHSEITQTNLLVEKIGFGVTLLLVVLYFLF